MRAADLKKFACSDDMITTHHRDRSRSASKPPKRQRLAFCRDTPRLYVLSHADQVHDREELTAVEDLVTEHLNEVVHELAGRHWLATVPADALGCLAARFHHGQDQDLTRMRGWTTRSASLTWALGSPGSWLAWQRG
jgi:hypothetical protein